MPPSLRRLAVLTTAICGLGGVVALAAPPVSGSATGAPAGSGQMQMNSGTTANTPAQMNSGATMPPNAGQAASEQQPEGKMGARVEQRIADMQTKLQISGAQKPQWDHLTQIMRDNARDMDRAFQTRLQSLDTMNAEQNIKSYATITQAHARDTERLVPAFDALYAKLSDTQKKAADQLFRDAALRTSTGQGNG